MVNLINLTNWIRENEKFLEPPVGNKLLYDGQLKVFIVKGPNDRQDFHINNGEEVFFMLRGDMILTVIYNNEYRNIVIKEDEMFILPRKIPHSPQRPPKSLGMVIERKRKETELDGIRFYGDNLNEIVFEKWFKCEKLDRDLVPILTEWNEKRDKPLPKKFREVKPFDWSSCIEFKAPMKLQCLSNNPLDDCKGDCFAHKNNSFSVALKETVVKCLQSGQHVLDNSDNSCDLFIWHHGSFAQFEYPNTNYMVNDDCLLLREKGSFVLTNEGHTLLIKMSL